LKIFNRRNKVALAAELTSHKKEGRYIGEHLILGFEKPDFRLKEVVGGFPGWKVQRFRVQRFSPPAWRPYLPNRSPLPTGL